MMGVMLDGLSSGSVYYCQHKQKRGRIPPVSPSWFAPGICNWQGWVVTYYNGTPLIQPKQDVLAE